MDDTCSFLVARKGPITDKMREAIVKFTEEVLLGDVLDKEDAEDLYPDMADDGFMMELYGDDPDMMEYVGWESQQNEKKRKKALSAFKRGWIVSGGRLDFEMEEEGVTDTYLELIKRLAKADPEHFKVIWHDLDKSWD